MRQLQGAGPAAAPPLLGGGSHSPPGAYRLIGRSAVMRELRQTATDIAHRRTTVMILGPTGSGKEMVARHIHAHSGRADGPFVPVDCTTLSETLFESELFGHAKGAFTGATHDTLGMVRAAGGGTLFLDELGELSLSMQAKLLRVLQERRVTPVGSTRSFAVDVRVLCATHRDLPKMVRLGTFREDLYYRLNVIVLQVPPLAARAADVPELAEHFLRTLAEVYEETPKRLGPEAAAVLSRYGWPGNVRELANAMESAHVLCRDDVIPPDALPARITAADAPARPVDRALHLPTLEKDAILEALRRCRNNKTAASRLLGLNIQRLKRRMQSLGVSG